MKAQRVLLAVALVWVSVTTVAAQSFTIGTQFSGATRAQSGFFPPDTMGAIGPNNYVELINGRYVNHDRTGTQLSASSLDAFWNTALAAGGGGTVQGSFSFDPRIMYDRHSGRWFATAVDSGSNANSGILVGVTTGNDPGASNWRAFRFDADANNLRWADYPTMGVNGNWVSISNNMFGISGATTSISMLTIPKASLTAAVPSVTGSKYFNDTVSNPGAGALINAHGFTNHSAYDYSNSSPGTAYSVSRFNNTTLQVSTVSGAVNNPSFTGSHFVTTANRAMGNINAPQLGANDNIDAGDNRISGSPVIVNGKLWVVHTFDNGGISRSVVSRIDTATNTLEYEGVIPISNSALWTYYPSIGVNQFGDIAVAFSGSDDNSFVSSYAIAGKFDGVNVSWGTEMLLQAGLANYSVLDGSGRNRWGDYSALQVDPNDPRSMWAITEYADAANSWRMRITQLNFASVPEPAGMMVLIFSMLACRVRIRKS